MLGAHHYYRLLADPATLDRVEAGFTSILARVVRADITPPALDRDVARLPVRELS